MRVRTAAILVAVTLLTFVAGSVSTSAKGPFERIVVFGTSLSDSGNAFALQGFANTPPDYDLDGYLVPGAPYAKGGHHFSNGATWVEQLARPLGLAGSVRPALRSSDPGAMNFAVGGARARGDGNGNTLTAQVDAFLLQSGGVAPSDGLYVIEMGSNDVRDAFAAFAGGGDGGAILTAANISIATSIQRLYTAGARQFLVWRVPNIALTPAIREIDAHNPGAALVAAQVSQGFNVALDGVVAQLPGVLPGIKFQRLDAFTLLNTVVAQPSLFGLKTVDEACVTPSIAPFACRRPDEFLFWDGIHPTAAGHAVLAQEAAKVLLQ